MTLYFLYKVSRRQKIQYKASLRPRSEITSFYWFLTTLPTPDSLQQFFRKSKILLKKKFCPCYLRIVKKTFLLLTKTAGEILQTTLI